MKQCHLERREDQQMKKNVKNLLENHIIDLRGIPSALLNIFMRLFISIPDFESFS